MDIEDLNWEKATETSENQALHLLNRGRSVHDFKQSFWKYAAMMLASIVLMLIFYTFGWNNPDEIDKCISLDYRQYAGDAPIPTAKFNVLKAWTDCYKIDFYLAVVMLILVLT